MKNMIDGTTQFFLPGLRDKKLKTGRWRGEVLSMSANGKLRICAIAYGNTLTEVRLRKRAIFKSLKKLLDAQ